MINLDEEWELPYAQYLEAGFKIFPLHPIVNGQCKCDHEDCKAIGKHPISSGWQNGIEWEQEQIQGMREFGQLHPAVGVLVSDGMLVVDVDERNGGVESLARLEADIGISIKDSCKFAVQSGSGGASAHYYFRSSELPKLRQGLKEYPGIDFKSSGYVVGWGSPHLSGLHYERIKGFPEDVSEPPLQLLDKLKAPERYSGHVDGSYQDVDAGDLKVILEHIDPAACTYEQWLQVGMGLHETTSGDFEACALWDDWSHQDSARYEDGACERRWHGFGKAREVVTLGTVMHMAREGGYQTPVTFNATVDFDMPETTTRLSIESLAKGIQPWDMPGFAGRLYQWIDGQCRYARPNVVAGATLYALSSIGGMRYCDARDDLPLNMMVFSVAGTGTGKEAIGQAVSTLFSKVGIIQAMHGKIKSEQEIYRNLIDHQLAAYNIDELGIMLQKIDGATKKGGAVYLTGVIGALMEIYSKANGILAVTGDLKKEIQEKLLNEAARITKRLDDGSTDPKLTEQLEQVKKSLKDAAEGIVNPYLTMLGTTTPTTFDSIITPENAQNGFIARALILREHEDNPRWREGFKKAPLDDMMLMQLRTMHYGGYSFADERIRIEKVGDAVDITTTPEAAALLDEVYEYFWQKGEAHKEATGLVGIMRRGWEMASKISLVVAMADGAVRKPEHVIYGFAMAQRDAEMKAKYAYSSDVKADNAAVVYLLSRLHESTPTTLGEIKRSMKNRFRLEVSLETMLDQLEQAGSILSEDKVPGAKGGRPSKVYYKCVKGE